MTNALTYKESSKLIDEILRIAAGGVFIGTAFLAPQILQILDKPAHKLLDKLDERDKQRKITDSIGYMRRQGLLIGDYEHGISVTNKALKRLERSNFSNLEITQPDEWDQKWRLVFFDIPEISRTRRVALTNKIRLLGFQPLQQSIWVHPFACKDVIELVCSKYGVTTWVSYIVTEHIDHEKKLIDRFSAILSP